MLGTVFYSAASPGLPRQFRYVLKVSDSALLPQLSGTKGLNGAKTRRNGEKEKELKENAKIYINQETYF